MGRPAPPQNASSAQAPAVEFKTPQAAPQVSQDTKGYILQCRGQKLASQTLPPLMLILAEVMPSSSHDYALGGACLPVLDKGCMRVSDTRVSRSRRCHRGRGHCETQTALNGRRGRRSYQPEAHHCIALNAQQAAQFIAYRLPPGVRLRTCTTCC